jgi:hypothetical protein
MEIYEEGITKKLTWQSGDEEDVNRALEFFTKLTRQGWLAVKKNGGYKRVLEFRPEYGELWFMPIVEGG